MNKTFAAALRRATDLTRGGSLGDATRAIQDALRGLDPSTAPSDTEKARPERTLSARPTLDLTAETVGARRPAPGPTSPADAGPVRPDPVAGSDRRTRPLAEAIRDLAAGRRTFAGLPQGLQATPPPPVPDGARYLARTYAGPHGGRPYRVYVPASASAGAKGLVMMLHGCKQNPDDFATGTAMNSKADADGLIVVYPAQPTGANPSACWNWFDAANQTRGSGEPAILAGLARAVADEFAVPPDAVFVAGLSAGGAMAAILAETYPDVFSAAGIHSGLPVGAAGDMASAFAAMAGRRRSDGRSTPGSSARLIVFHGAADTVVHPSNADAIVSLRRRGTASVDRHAGRTQAGRRFERTVYRAADGAGVLEHWVLDDHGHSWSGGHPSGSYTDPAGPDASAEMVRFFLEARSAGRRD
ncbi:extracellular catalytic domain type 1 short-chain-length polyhydroxyalkanoate depolymerase [Chthonobacter rhizosphaerae]|uniref:extracellular catalytic domain type 1 short-chain-length polyhydroxyalkanoate depolymerase n=1 Tax=Chthonobacter rhizosphaerae TaxID=2735553 RepID=UPI0015EFB9B0|nr:PHB depolymerase family esterase [Chthonobacter rhizosphaerae]